MSLPCEECVKTKNHCCVADIPYAMLDVLFYRDLANKMGIETHVFRRPGDEHAFVLLPGDLKPGQDVRQTPCVFLKDGQCSIYEHRPSICRAYGTDYMKCRFDHAGITTESEIAACSEYDIHRLDEEALSVEKIESLSILELRDYVRMRIEELVSC